MSGMGKHDIVYENESKASLETNTIHKTYISPYTVLHNHSKFKETFDARIIGSTKRNIRIFFQVLLANILIKNK
jgi:hypothetical protein